ncbi:hypothetical protein LTR22_026084 [Elasticomyces elasticus]|nr:hypothetical protein LTR22_026084 [Elasticomyces elasticus]KAK4903831.1 hypothetical protein LTR49_026611 [Elasticomyces elasticus]
MQKDNSNVNVMDTPDQAQGSQDQDKTQNQDRDRVEGESNIQDPTGVSDHLPGGEAVWKDSVLGHHQLWSNELQSYALTLSCFPYPAAVYWGEELILLHNEAWTEAGCKAEQGQPQRGTLTVDGFWALSSALHGGQQKKITSRELLRTNDEEQHEKFTVLISPLFIEHSRKAGAAGLLAQMLPKREHSGGRKGPGLAIGDLPHAHHPSGSSLAQGWKLLALSPKWQFERHVIKLRAHDQQGTAVEANRLQARHRQNIWHQNATISRSAAAAQGTANGVYTNRM